MPNHDVRRLAAAPARGWRRYGEGRVW